MILSYHERQERRAARTDEFKSGAISEDVYRASLFALGYRGDDIDMEVRWHRPAPGVPEWVGIMGRAISARVMIEGNRKIWTAADWERFIAGLWKDNQCAR